MLASLRALQFLIYWRVVDFLSCRSRTDSIRRGPPMQQIADWLKKLGLPEYGERFAENGVDVSVLPHLTDQDLKEMGVLLGHRRKMLAAIGELSSRAPATDTSIGPAAIPAAVAVASPIAIAAEAAGERRYLTVMFCDLVDSTSIAARLD